MNTCSPAVEALLPGRGRGPPPGRGRGTFQLATAALPRGEEGGPRQKQAAAVGSKGEAEDRYFRQCQKERKSGEAQKVKAGLTGQAADAREKALFEKQGSQGIQFDKYSDIKVQSSGPGADSAAPLDSFASLELPSFWRATLR